MNLCDKCETVSHCSKHGCIPLAECVNSGQVSAAQVVAHHDEFTCPHCYDRTAAHAEAGDMAPPHDLNSARRELGKWLNEEQLKPVDRQALAVVLAHLQTQPREEVATLREALTEIADTKIGWMAALQANAAAVEPTAWINLPIEMQDGEFLHYGDPELSFKRQSYGYAYDKAEPLYKHPPVPARAQEVTDWRIDTSTGAPILVYQDCSVIQDEQAKYVLDLIAADNTLNVTKADSQVNDAEPPKNAPWFGCGECDVSFKCYSGKVGCIRADQKDPS